MTRKRSPLLAGVFLLAGALLLAAGPLAAASRWTALGPFGGTILTLTADPSNAAVLYATTGLQGTFKSADAGLSWTPIRGTMTTGNVAVDPSRPATLYLAAYAGAVLKSTDGGAHWIASGNGLGSLLVASLAVDPARPSRVYAASNQGLWRSDDGGGHWVHADRGLPGGAAADVATVAALRNPTGTVFAGTRAHGLFRSADAGATWRPAGASLPDEGVTAFVAAPSSPRNLYAAFRFTGVFRSADGGATWQRTPAQPANRFVLSLAVSPRTQRELWAGTDGGGVFRSTDAGYHWTAAGPPAQASVPALATAGRTLFAGVKAGADGGGVFASDIGVGGGASWQRRVRGLAGLTATALAFDPRDPASLWAALPEQGLFHSPNGGLRWLRAPLPPPGARGPRMPFDLAFTGADPALILTADVLWRTTDGAATWTPLLRPAGILVPDPTDPAALYTSSTSSAAVTRDRGDHWTPLAPSISCFLLDLAPAGATVYAAGAKASSPFSCRPPTVPALSRSTDGGATWTPADAGLPGQRINRVAVDPADPARVYAGTGADVAGPGDGVWRSRDGGATWERAGDELAGTSIDALRTSPMPGVVWAATDDGRVFRSGDDGTTWEERSAGLQSWDVRDLVLDPAEPRLVYAVGAGGVWRLDDREP